MSKSNYSESAVLNAWLRSAAFPKPSNIYIGLITTLSSTESGTPAEPVGNGYGRVALAVADASWSAPVDEVGTMVVTNTGEIAFATVTGSGWGTIVGFIVATAVSGGEVIYEGALNAPQTVQAGNPIRFPPGSLKIGES